MIRSINGTTSFKGVGVSDTLVKTFESLAKGGKAAEFLTQDVLSCGLPRTVSSLNRNKEKTGHLNYVAAAETGLRESLTGSSTFLVPLSVLAIARKMTGKANDIPVKSIKDLSEIMGNGRQVATARHDFYFDTFKRVGENMNLSKEEAQNFAKDFTEQVEMLEKAPKRNFFARMFKKGDGTHQDEILEKITNNFVKVRKNQAESLSDDVLGAQLSKGNSVKINKLVKHMKNFADEFVDKCKCEKDIKAFRNLRMGTRFLSTIGVFALTGAVLVVLPKLYSISKTNPEAEIDQPQGGQK